MSGCQCSLATRLVGDGCKHCNPAMYVEIIEKRCEDLELELATLRLTDAERADIEYWLAECERQCSAATDGGNAELAERWQGRAKRAAAMLERIGGER